MRRSTLAVALVLAGCTSVDSTEHCIETRYGNVVNEQMHNGLNATVFTEATCFPLTDQNFPEDGEATEIPAQTGGGKDPITLNSDVAVVFAYAPGSVVRLFQDKRSQTAALVEVTNSIRDGYRSALAMWTIEDIFGPRRGELGDSAKAHMQRKIGSRAVIKTVYIRDIKAPQQIERARIDASQKALLLTQARQQFQIDSVNATARLLEARSTAEATRLRADAYDQNARLLDLEIAREMAKMCAGVTTCVLGGSVMDTWRGPGGER